MSDTLIFRKAPLALAVAAGLSVSTVQAAEPYECAESPDQVVNSLADGPINTEDSVVTLREALWQLDGGEGGSIGFDVTGTIHLDGSEGELNWNAGDSYGQLEICGPGADRLVIDAGGNSRVLSLNGYYTDMALANITITGGRVEGSYTRGGGVHVTDEGYGYLTLSDAVVAGNRIVVSDSDEGSSGAYASVSGSGGGLFIDEYVSAEISNSSIVGNSITASATATASTDEGTANATGYGFLFGGGVFADYDLAVYDSTISGNRISGTFTASATSADSSAVSSGYAYTGGGGLAGKYSLELSQATISGNRVDVFTAANSNAGNDEASENSWAAVMGGGVLSSAKYMTIEESTITANTTSVQSDETELAVAGLAIMDGGEGNIGGSIVSGNTGSTSDGTPVLDTYVMADLYSEYSLMTSNSNVDFAPYEEDGDSYNTGNVIADDPVLSPLMYTGGSNPVAVHLPKPTSPAIDMVPAGYNLGYSMMMVLPEEEFDARGEPRLYGLGQDAGAVERQALEIDQIIVQGLVEQLADDEEGLFGTTGTGSTPLPLLAALGVFFAYRRKARKARR